MGSPTGISSGSGVLLSPPSRIEAAAALLAEDSTLRFWTGGSAESLNKGQQLDYEQFIIRMTARHYN